MMSWGIERRDSKDHEASNYGDTLPGTIIGNPILLITIVEIYRIRIMEIHRILILDSIICNPI